MNDMIVETYGLTKTYRSGRLENPVLKGIDLEVERSEIVSIMGASGCGKTTLLNILGGLDRPTNGRVCVDGQNLNKMNDTELTTFRLKKMGFVFQFFNLIPTLTAVENVQLPLLIAGRGHAKINERPLLLLGQVGLSDKAERMPYELSGGEQQRVAIARALVNSPSIVLADEPTGNLDSKTSANLIDLFNVINNESGQTFILVTHDSEVAESADRIVYMKDGGIIDDKRKIGLNRAIETNAKREELKILSVVNDLDALYLSHTISGDVYERLRAEYINRLIEFEIRMNTRLPRRQSVEAIKLHERFKDG